MEFAQGAQQQMVGLREQLEDAKVELQSIQELAQSQLQALVKCECSAAYTVETEGVAWQEYGDDAPLSVVMRLANDHIEVLSTHPCPCAVSMLLYFVDCAQLCTRVLCTVMNPDSVYQTSLVPGTT